MAKVKKDGKAAIFVRLRHLSSANAFLLCFLLYAKNESGKREQKA
jgi:hypothetical protein